MNKRTFIFFAPLLFVVRHLYLSNRPWDNGWSATVGENDVQEVHPYLYNKFSKKDAFSPALPFIDFGEAEIKKVSLTEFETLSEINKGQTKLQADFLDKYGHLLCGAYYVNIEKIR